MYNFKYIAVWLTQVVRRKPRLNAQDLLYNVNCTEINYKGIVTTEAVDEVDVPLTITHTCSFCLNKENGGEISHYAFDWC